MRTLAPKSHRRSVRALHKAIISLQTAALRACQMVVDKRNESYLKALPGERYFFLIFSISFDNLPTGLLRDAFNRAFLKNSELVKLHLKRVTIEVFLMEI